MPMRLPGICHSAGEADDTGSARVSGNCPRLRSFRRGNAFRVAGHRPAGPC